VGGAGRAPCGKSNGGGVDDGKREFSNLILFISISGSSKE
jgi:hypothetical protein